MDVLLFMAAVNDRSRAHEQQGFEKGVRDQMKHPDGRAAGAQTDHHVAELRDGGVGEDAFDVVLRNRYARGEDSSDSADPGDNGERGRRYRYADSTMGAHQRINSGDEKYA